MQKGENISISLSHEKLFVYSTYKCYLCITIIKDIHTMAEIINFQEVLDKAKDAEKNALNMSEVEKEQEAVINLVCHLTDTIFEEPKDDELQLTVRLADLAHLAEGYMELLKQVAEIKKAAQELLGE